MPRVACDQHIVALPACEIAVGPPIRHHTGGSKRRLAKRILAFYAPAMKCTRFEIEEHFVGIGDRDRYRQAEYNHKTHVSASLTDGAWGLEAHLPSLPFRPALFKKARHSLLRVLRKGVQGHYLFRIRVRFWLI